MLKKKFNIFFIFICTIAIGCKDNPVENNTETLVYQRDGVIERLGGDCSAVQVRTSTLGSFDFRNVRKIKFNLTGMSDADLSSIAIYRIENNENVFLFNLANREQINSTRTLEIDSPDFQGELFLRVTLKSSVCTGQIFFLEIRDLKIYTIR